MIVRVDVHFMPVSPLPHPIFYLFPSISCFLVAFVCFGEIVSARKIARPLYANDDDSRVFDEMKSKENEEDLKVNLQAKNGSTLGMPVSDVPQSSSSAGASSSSMQNGNASDKNKSKIHVTGMIVSFAILQELSLERDSSYFSHIRETEWRQRISQQATGCLR